MTIYIQMLTCVKNNVRDESLNDIYMSSLINN